MLVLALQFSRSDRRLRNNRIFTGLDAAASGIVETRSPTPSKRKRRRWPACAPTREGPNPYQPRGRSRQSTPVHQLEVSRIGWHAMATDDGEILLRKEVIQPHLPVRLPCYDFTPITDPTFDGSLPYGLGHRLRVLPTFVV